MPVHNLHHLGCFPPDHGGWIRIYRGTPYGNPFTHIKGNTMAAFVVDSREDAVEAYRLWLTSDLEILGWRKPTREMVVSLHGKDLACWCAPRACHGDVLLELAAHWAAEDSIPEVAPKR